MMIGLWARDPQFHSSEAVDALLHRKHDESLHVGSLSSNDRVGGREEVRTVICPGLADPDLESHSRGFRAAG